MQARLRPSCHVGVAHDIGRAGDRGSDNHDADARSNDDALVAYGIWRGDRLDHAPSHGVERGVIEDPEGEDGKLIAAEPGDDIVAT
jgi:hypothetical protein